MGTKGKISKRDVFISYRRSDMQLAALTYYFLENMGYDVWWDASLNYEVMEDDEYPTVIDCIIENCKDFVLLVTENTFESDKINNENDWIHREIKCALSNKRHIIPLHFENNSIPQDLPADIASVTKKIFYSFPINPYSKSEDEIKRSWRKLLKATPSYRHTDDKDNNEISYDPDQTIEILRANIQAENTKKFDMKVIDEIVNENNMSEITVLDVGCGDGTVGKGRFDNQCFSKVLGIDKSQKRIKDAYERTVAEDSRKFKYAKIDVENRNFRTDMEQTMMNLDIEGFDIIFMSQVLHFHREKEPLNWLLDLKKFLNPNGYIIVRESDDGSKMAYGSRGQDSLQKVLTMTTALRKVADRHMGRKLCNLLKGADFENVNIYTFMRDTSHMNYTERMNLYQESFGWRLSAVQGENDSDSSTVKEMEDNLLKLKTCFEGNPIEFWYCEYDYICVGQNVEEKNRKD